MIAYSKESRAKVTPDIVQTLRDLVKKEKDYQTKKVHPADWYSKEVADKLGLSEQNNPSLRSYEELLRGIRADLRKQNQTDEPWSIGSCDQLKVAPEIIPVLIQIQKFLDRFPGIDKQQILTKRHAIWYGRLYPSIHKLIFNQPQKAYGAFNTALLILFKTMLEGTPDESMKKMVIDAVNNMKANPKPSQADLYWLEVLWLVIIGVQYAKMEPVSDTPGEKQFDTTDLDKLFFVDEDLSVEALYDGFGTIFYFSKQQNILSKYKQVPLKILEERLGKITEKQAALINEYFEAMSSGFIERKKWERLHPAEHKEVSKLLEGMEEKK